MCCKVSHHAGTRVLEVACVAGGSSSILSALATFELTPCFGVLTLGGRVLPLEEILFSSSSSIFGNWMKGCCCNLDSTAPILIEAVCDQQAALAALAVMTGCLVGSLDIRPGKLARGQPAGVSSPIGMRGFSFQPKWSEQKASKTFN